MKIKDIQALEVLDSRGNPTIEATVILGNGISGSAMVPSGASTGEKEALELRDNDNSRYLGKGVLKALTNINIIKEKLIGLDINDLELIDNTMIELDGSDTKHNLGANSILAISLAAAHTRANNLNVELYQSFGNKDFIMPVPMINIINGGKHANNSLDIQEFMIVPSNMPSFKEALRCGAEIFHHLKKILNSKGLNTTVGDEGGFAPNLNNNEEALEMIVESIHKANYEPGADVFIALDCASSEFYQNDEYHLTSENQVLNFEQLVKCLTQWVQKYPIISIEDGMAENDIAGWKLLTKKLGDKIQLVGDDLFVTNSKILSYGIQENLANSILIKVNQIGTLTETFTTIELAKKYKYSTIMSHRSGETEDTTIADLAVATNCGQIKTGSLSRSERIAKYNRLLKIEAQLGNKAIYNCNNIVNHHK